MADKSLCLPKLKSITVLLSDFLTKNGTFSLLLLKSCSQVLATVIKIFNVVLNVIFLNFEM